MVTWVAKLPSHATGSSSLPAVCSSQRQHSTCSHSRSFQCLSRSSFSFAGSSFQRSSPNSRRRAISDTSRRVEDLNASVDTYLSNALASTTSATYRTGWSSYSNFCTAFNLARFPVTESNLVYYFTSLANRLISFRTMKVYLAAIVYFAKIHGFTFKHETMHRLHYLLVGIRRVQGARLTRARRPPITIPLLHSLHSFLAARCCIHDARMLWSACTAAFFGLLRVSEYTSPTGSTLGQSTLLRSHVTVAADYSSATIHLPISKTDQFGRGASVQLFALPSILCPVSALVHYMSARSAAPGPLFLFSDGSYLTRSHMVGLLRSVFPAQAHTNTHSFRIGGASALASAGVPDYIIQIMGRWSSDSFLRYISIPHQAVREFQVRVASQDTG